MENKKSQPVFVQKWKSFWGKVRSVTDPIERTIGKIGNVLYRMRKLFMTIPVVLLGMRVFLYAKEKLPADVGLLLQENGVYKYMLDKNTALSCCMVITGACILLMYMSRKIVYPWIISLFSLVLPIFLVISNMFPA